MWLRRHEAVRLPASAARRQPRGPPGKPGGTCSPPDRPGRLPPAEGHPDPPRRGTAAHQRPGSDLAIRVAANSRAIAEKCAHLRGLPYGRIDISTTESRASWSSNPPRWTRRSAPGHPPGDRPGIALCGLVPRRPPSATRSRSGSSRRPASRWNCPVGRGGRQGHRRVRTTGSGKTTVLNDVRERVTAMDDAVLVQLNARRHRRRADLGAARRRDRRRPAGRTTGRAGSDHRRPAVGAAPDHRAVSDRRADRRLGVPADPRKTRPSS